MFRKVVKPSVQRLWSITLLALVAAMTAPASAQILPPFDPDNPLSAGVQVDADGLLAVRRSTEDPKLLATRKAAFLKAQRLARAADDKDQLTYISLPRLFAEAKSHIDAGKELPEKLRYLDGMTKLRYVFVFPGESDLVIAGDAEPYDASNPARPIGLRTGRPVLRLDDLVVALRTVGPGRHHNTFGCSIDLPPGALKTVTDVMNDPANRRISKAKKSELLADSVGAQGVRFFGVKADTQVAFVCVEADYILKRLAMGVDPTPVQAVRAVHQKEKLEYSRLWFTPSFEPLLVSADGNAFEIRGQSLKLNASGDQRSQTDATPGTTNYAKQFTKHFPQMAAAIPAFADLWNITDLALVAALIGQDRLHEKASWKLDWLLDEKAGYPVPKVPVAREADTVANYRTGVYVIGGVTLDFSEYVKPDARDRDEDGKLKELESRPANEDWKSVKPKDQKTE